MSVRHLIHSGAAVTLLLFSLGVKAESFVVQDIQVEGLQRISPGTVFNYLPVGVGGLMEPGQAGEAIRALYQTGFFDDVALERRGNVLVISVTERPAIGQIEVEGNKAISKEPLLMALREIGLAEGRVFNQAVLDRMEQELNRQYFNLGKYDVQIQSETTPLERNRVAVRLKIEEGETARIRQINIVGAEAFSQEELLKLFESGVRGTFSFFSKRDQYSRSKLAADLETLRSFYLDRGYIHFNIDSTQVSITPDKKEIYITVNITEGDVYTISDLRLAGELMVEPGELYPLIGVRRGDLFSRKAVLNTSDRITARLGDEGYAFANVNSIPEVDEQSRQVAITFFVDPGNRVYVRRINITGNHNTRDEVLRRELRQMESAWFSSQLVQISRERLRRLGYFDNVAVETPQVPGSSDQVDVNITVTERPAGNLMAGVGFSQSDGFLLNASISQANFMGTGKQVSFAFNNSSSQTEYRLAYDNPYYTINGVSRGFDLRYRSTDYAEHHTAAYATDEMIGQVNFGVPINENDRIRFDLSVKNTDFRPGSRASDEILSFVDQVGDNFLDYVAGASWIRDTRDSAIFPHRGGFQRIATHASIPGSDLTYYKASYKNRQYLPITDTLTFSINGELGYGDAYGDLERLPFFENYFSGGIRTVRGYKSYSLGPRDSNEDPLGANMMVLGNVELLFPPPFGGGRESPVRIGAFVDGGMVFDSKDGGFNSEDLRYSTGLSLVWMSPVGILGLVYAEPLNEKPGDERESFQFTFGTSF